MTSKLHETKRKKIDASQPQAKTQRRKKRQSSKNNVFFQKDVDLLLKSNLNWNANAEKDARSF